MIRLIQRRLIIPRGDTGTFSIPMQGTMGENDVAILSVFDPLTHRTLFNKIGITEDNVLKFNFVAADTLNEEPSKRYLWDIAIYRNAVYTSDPVEVTSAETVDSYYAAFKLPTCEIRTVTTDVQK